MSQFCLHKDDRVGIVWGNFVCQEDRVTQVYCKKWVIHVNRIQHFFIFIFIFCMYTLLHIILNIGVFFVGLG